MTHFVRYEMYKSIENWLNNNLYNKFNIFKLLYGE